MFADRGFAAVTTRQIAKAADVAFPIMYRHFGNKRRLYLTAFSDQLHQLNHRYTALLRSQVSPGENLLAFISGLYKDLMSDPFVSKFMQREIIDRDFEGLEQMTRSNFVETYHIVQQLCADLVGKTKSNERANLVYALTMGLSQFRHLGLVVSPRSTRWADPDAMGRLILNLVFPKTNWSRLTHRRPKRGG